MQDFYIVWETPEDMDGLIVVLNVGLVFFI